MHKSHISVVLAALLLAGPAGCQAGEQAAPPPSAASAPASPSAGLPSAGLPSAALPSAALPSASSAPATTTRTSPAPASAEKAFPLTLSRQGGFAGVDDRVTITADGSATLTRRGKPAVRISVPPTALNELRLVLGAAELNGQAPPPNAPVCNDGFEYEVVTPSSTTRFEDCGASHGDAVDRVLAVAAQLFDS